MKKTIIAMLALSGVAFGATDVELNTNLDAWLNEAGYSAAETSYTLKYTVTLDAGHTGRLAELADSWYIWTQVSNYIGVTTTNNPNDWGYSDGLHERTTPFQSDLKINSNHWLVDSNGPSNEYGPQNGIMGDVEVTISSTIMFGLSATTLSVAHGDTTWVNANIQDVNGNNIALDLNAFDFTLESSSATLQIGTNEYNLTQAAPAIPEPTTATLSLLALAGLAARRRRK